MQRTKYAVEFKSEAVKQVIDKGHAFVDAAKRLGIGVLNRWVNKFKSQNNVSHVTLRRCKPRWSSLRRNSGGPQRSATS
jgi:transposase-like protein